MGPIGRLFLALDLSAEAKQALVAQLNELDVRIPGRLVPPENWHLTLRFLGEVMAVEYDRLLMQLSTADLGESFRFALEGMGAFPKEKRAAVLWSAIGEGSDSVRRLAAIVEERVCASGLPPEDRPFRAHLTLSRIRPPEDVSGLLVASRDVRVLSRAVEVSLYRSHLGSGGAKYELMERFELK